MSTATRGLEKHGLAAGTFYRKRYLSYVADFRFNRDEDSWYAIVVERDADGHRGGGVAVMFCDFVTLDALRTTVDRWVEARADRRLPTPVQLELAR